MKKPPVKEGIKKEVRNNGNRVAAEISNKTATAISSRIMNRDLASNKGRSNKEGLRGKDLTNQTSLSKAHNKGNSKGNSSKEGLSHQTSSKDREGNNSAHHKTVRRKGRLEMMREKRRLSLLVCWFNGLLVYM